MCVQLFRSKTVKVSDKCDAMQTNLYNAANMGSYKGIETVKLFNTSQAYTLIRFCVYMHFILVSLLLASSRLNKFVD